MTTIDINGDLGESYGNFRVGDDERLMQVITSANIACGFHAGDFNVMNTTVDLAKQHDVAIGAHPGLPDIFGFGRRRMDISAEEAHHLVTYQLGALAAFTKLHGTRLHHVKPHGALYNMAAKDRQLADAVARAVRDFDPQLKLVGLCNSALVEAGHDVGLPVLEEAFADRTYTEEGQLTPRSEPNAVLEDQRHMEQQVLKMVEHGQVTTSSGHTIALKPDTICFHGDGAEAFENVRYIRRILGKKGISISPAGGKI
ncbi:LamB/YcsF family protein [Thalassobacillus sp. CUG 92003]|uniref:LamB/YcsF family protein n=1 Tax=Thalassobacillus sp. CUG 92003 TaxID=2736641 RepID=UPI0015E7C56C|nr:5-oxoprolinase subunit PxpA [Thalassobacillus sp. CUG 92003]